MRTNNALHNSGASPCLTVEAAAPNGEASALPALASSSSMRQGSWTDDLYLGELSPDSNVTLLTPSPPMSPQLVLATGGESKGLTRETLAPFFLPPSLFDRDAVEPPRIRSLDIERTSFMLFAAQRGRLRVPLVLESPVAGATHFVVTLYLSTTHEPQRSEPAMAFADFTGRQIAESAKAILQTAEFAQTVTDACAFEQFLGADLLRQVLMVRDEARKAFEQEN